MKVGMIRRATETNVSQRSQPRTFTDPSSEVLRRGARALRVQAVQAEVAALMAGQADKPTDDGRARLVRHGQLPERGVMTGSGPVVVPSFHLDAGTAEE